ncbi:uncharacterized protein [Venturia canescens]|uniref:uncharacterized protein n=1 Tax=Venturia canescens TaxID=32260 RepID=UPI001C9CCF02|nr:uncharacterized protein LOC122418892 [Venturia canescens]
MSIVCSASDQNETEIVRKLTEFADYYCPLLSKRLICARNQVEIEYRVSIERDCISETVSPDHSIIQSVGSVSVTCTVRLTRRPRINWLATMKIAPIIFLGLVGLTSCYARTVESVCSRGPEVFCATEENAALCNQLEFCSHYNAEEVRIEKHREPTPGSQVGQWYWWG